MTFLEEYLSQVHAVNLEQPLQRAIKISVSVGRANGHGPLRAGDPVWDGNAVLPSGTVLQGNVGQNYGTGYNPVKTPTGIVNVPTTGNHGGWYEVEFLND